MVYMHATSRPSTDGPAAENVFGSIASVGSSTDVNYVVQKGLASGAERYCVRLGENAPDAVLAATAVESDMGSPVALESFVTWAKRRYPASRYALIVWSHGAGWQKFAGDGGAGPIASTATEDATALRIQDSFRSLAPDSNTQHRLYNRQIQTVLERLAQSDGRRIDILGFDACFMGMLETAYAMKRGARILVASEELEYSWPYPQWMRALNLSPQITAERLASQMVSTYGDAYSNWPSTLSAVALDRIAAASQSFSAFAHLLRARLREQRKYVETARGNRYFGDWYRDRQQAGYERVAYSTDLLSFLKAFATITNDRQLKAGAARVYAKLDALILAHRSSTGGGLGPPASGIGIFFPKERAHFEVTQSPAYVRGGCVNAEVEFVADTEWPLFLSDYLGVDVSNAAIGCPTDCACSPPYRP